MSGSHLRSVEQAQEEPDAPASSTGHGGGGGGGGIESRLARLETHLRYLATKEDVQKIKVWVLGGVIGGMVTALGLAVGLLKLLP